MICMAILTVPSKRYGNVAVVYSGAVCLLCLHTYTNLVA